MTPELHRACLNAVHVITGQGQTIAAGRAVVFVLAALGWPRWLAYPLARPPLIWCVELGYRLVAQNRPFFGKFLFRQ